MIVFIINHPLRWQQPETLRLHYYAHQDGIKEGSLTGALTRTDWLKPFVWRAHGGMYDARQPSMLLDAVIAKFDQLLYRRFGPFLDEPFFILLVFMIAPAVALLVREWIGSGPAGMIAGGMWLFTTEALLGSRYNCRSNMLLVALLSLLSLWILLRMRELPAGRANRHAVLLGFLLLVQLHTHEITFCLLPVILWLLVVYWPRLRRQVGGIAAAVIIPFAWYLIYLLLVGRWLGYRVTGEWPPLSWVQGGLSPLLTNPGVILERTKNFFLFGLKWFSLYNLGGSPFGSPWLGWLAAGIWAVLLIIAGFSFWRKVWVPLVAWLIYIFPATVFIFPVVPTAIEAETYYYASIVAMGMVLVGAGASAVLNRRRAGIWGIWVGGLLVIGFLNTRTASEVLDNYPECFGYNEKSRQFVDDILALGQAVKQRTIPLPAYVAYPRPKRFNISARWDIMLRVWKGNPESVFAMMLPVVNLEHYESRLLLGEPKEFYATASLEEIDYLTAARSFIDMPHRKVYDLERVRRAGKRGQPTPGDRVWESESDSSVSITPPVENGLLGRQLHSRLPPGKWRMKINTGLTLTPSPLLVMLIRADLTPFGHEDVMERVQPLPLRYCRVSIRKARAAAPRFSREQSYDWSFELITAPLTPDSNDDWEVVLDSDTEMEIVGPIVIDEDNLLSLQMK